MAINKLRLYNYYLCCFFYRDIVVFGQMPVTKSQADRVLDILTKIFKVIKRKDGEDGLNPKSPPVSIDMRTMWLNFLEESYRDFVNPLMPNKSGLKYILNCTLILANTILMLLLFLFRLRQRKD